MKKIEQMGVKHHSSALAIQQLHLNYGFAKSKVQILSNLNLCVEVGTIYGVLGPSGCGKTSLLRCVVGRLHPSNGIIEVFGRKLGSEECGVPGSSVGYMPQELALYLQLSISEILNYFGRLHSMDKCDVKKSIRSLTSLLDLPAGNRIIQQLSGGQKRRVSLAVALLHEPPLLILDEPTVGVDPILRESIWKHLVNLCNKQQVTVVITTHYIEEARQANKVGFMRSGRILVEDTPDALLDRYQLPTLENVYHKLCEEDDHKEDELNLDNQKRILSTKSESYSRLNEPVIAIKQSKKKNFLPQKSQRKVLGLVIKNLHQVRRNPTLILLQFIIPAIQISALFLGMGSNPHDLPVAVYNEDKNMGIKYLRHIDNQTIHQLPVDSFQDGVDLVTNGKAVAVIHIEKKFTNALMDRFTARGNVSQDVVRASKLHLRLDATNQQKNFFVNVALMKAYSAFCKDELGNVKKYPKLVHFLLETSEPIYSNFNNKFIGRDFICSAFSLCISYINAIGMTAVQLIIDRQEGLYERSVVSGVTISEMIFSYILSQNGFLLTQTSIVIVFAQLVFNMHIGGTGSILLFMNLVALQGISGMSLGLLISAICDKGGLALMLSTLIFLPGIAMGGLFWTLLGMHGFLLQISYFFPHTLAAESIRWIVFRGKDILWQNVWLGFLSTIVWIFVYITLAVIVLRLRRL